MLFLYKKMIDILGEFFLEAIVWVFAEIIFYTFCYFTGVVLTRLVTFGKYYPGDLIKDKELRQAHRSKGNKFTYVKANRKYLSFDTVSLIGLTFWIIVCVVAVIFMTF